MHLTFGTGIFWLLMVSGIGEVIVRLAKVRSGARDEADRPPEVDAHIADLQRRLEQQDELLHTQAETIARLEESTQFMEKLLRGRAEGAVIPPATS